MTIQPVTPQGPPLPQRALVMASPLIREADQSKSRVKASNER